MITVLRKSFAAHDQAKTGSINTDEIEEILNGMGTTYDPEDLSEVIRKVDSERELLICLIIL